MLETNGDFAQTDHMGTCVKSKVYYGLIQFHGLLLCTPLPLLLLTKRRSYWSVEMVKYK